MNRNRHAAQPGIPRPGARSRTRVLKDAPGLPAPVPWGERRERSSLRAPQLLLLGVVLAFGSTLLCGSLYGASTINVDNHCAWGANIGWLEARGDVVHGAVVGEYICSGFIYAANVGWINLGNGLPADGIRYRNGATNDFGVNHDGLGNLRGAAWGANIGWIRFEDAGAPKVNLASGEFSGYAYSANCGWISLSNAQARVQTDTIACGPDADGDGISDPWELSQFGNLDSANALSDADGDGRSDQQEYLADTDPLEARDAFRITSVRREGERPFSIRLMWTSQPTRRYAVERRSALDPLNLWEEIYLLPWPGASNAVFDQIGDKSFYRVRAFRPLSP